MEIKKLPIIVLTGPTLRERTNMRTQAEIEAKDAEQGVFVKEKTPRWFNLSFRVLVAAERFSDILDRTERLSRLAQESPLLKVTQEGTGRVREYLWDWTELPSNSTTPNFSGIYEAQGTLVVYDVEIYSGVTRDGTLIKNIEMEFTAGDGNSKRDGAEKETITEGERDA